MNSPESLVELWQLATEKELMGFSDKVYMAELIREVGLKCIGFNGVSLISGFEISFMIDLFYVSMITSVLVFLFSEFIVYI